MTALVLAVLGASLAGSLHCAAMCGSFACLASASPRADVRTSASAVRGGAAYHAGRLAAYVSLGLVAGGLGGAADRIGAGVGVQRAAALVASVVLLGWGVALLARARGVRLPGAGGGEVAARWLGRGLAALRDRSAATRGLALGVATALLPCGWLWAFLAAAAGTGAPAHAALAMAAFWLGTVPALVATAGGVRRLSARWRHRMPQVAAAALVVVATASLVRRLPGVTGHGGAPHVAPAVAPPPASHGHVRG